MTRFKVVNYIPKRAEEWKDKVPDDVPQHLLASVSSAMSGYPSLVSFASGANPPAESEPDIKIHHRFNSEQKHIDLSAVNRRTNDEWRACSSSLSDYVVAVVNKRDKTMTIVDVASEFCVARSTPRLGSSNVARSPEADERTYFEQRVHLLEKFGGKRAQDRQAKIQRNAITDERITEDVADQLNVAVEEHQQKSASAGIDDGTTSVLAPPHNASATKVEDAYPLIGLMPAVTYSAIRSEAQSFLEHAQSQADPVYVKNPGWHAIAWDAMLQALQVTEPSNADSDVTHEIMQRVVAAIYLHCLLVLASFDDRITSNDCQTLKDKMAVSGYVADRVLSQFTEQTGGGRNRKLFRSESLKAQLVYHAVVLWLTAYGFSTSRKFEEFAVSLDLSVAKLLIHIAHVGGKVKRIKAAHSDAGEFTYKASLTVPLSFPPIRRRGRRMSRA